MRKLFKMSRVKLLISVTFLFILQSSSLLAEVIPSPLPSGGAGSTRPLPMVMDGFCEFTKYYLSDPVSGEALTSRYMEIVILNGEADPPFEEGDDVVQTINLEFNGEHHRSFLLTDPGLIDAMVTVFVAKAVADDEKVQIWERIFLRVYNSDEKTLATHYVDTAAHEAQPGFYEMTAAVSPFGKWKELKH